MDRIVPRSSQKPEGLEQEDTNRSWIRDLEAHATNYFEVTELDEQIALNDVPDEVRQANLNLYSDAALTGRLAHYEREALLERDVQLSRAWKQETQRTRIEINRRKMYRQREADRVFAL